MPVSKMARTRSHIGIETVAAALQRLDVWPTVWHCAERLSQNMQILGEVGLLNDGVRPYPLHQLILAHHLSVSSGQYTQRCHRLGSQMKFFAVLQKEPRTDLKLKIPKLVDKRGLRVRIKVNFRIF